MKFGILRYFNVAGASQSGKIGEIERSHDHLIKKLNIDFKKTIRTFDYGNTSSASIPIALSKNFPNKLIKNKIFLFCGFGVGLSWSTVVTKIHKASISKVHLL